jgi:hypothetical protein
MARTGKGAVLCVRSTSLASGGGGFDLFASLVSSEGFIADYV